MKKNLLLSLIFLFSCSSLWSQDTLNATANHKKENSIFITFRGGQGGFKDTRSSIGKLGGGQMAIDVKYSKWPIAIGYSIEHYTNDPDPTHSYEIPFVGLFSLAYVNKAFEAKDIFIHAGVGAGPIRVPKGISFPGNELKHWAMGTELSVRARLVWKIGIYASYKYLYSNNSNEIDFSEHIGMFGIFIRFGI